MDTNIQYDEEPQYTAPLAQTVQKSFLIRTVLATGLVSTDRSAEYVLLGIAVVLLLLAILIPILSNKQQPVTFPSDARIMVSGLPPRTPAR